MSLYNKVENHNIIEVKNLTYKYPDGTEALKGIDLNVKRGEKLAIMGANGSGKSTFFLNLNGIIKRTDGSVVIDGEELEYSRKSLMRARKKIGIVFQNAEDQIFTADIKQEISFGLYNLGVDEEEIKMKVNQVVKDLGIEEFIDKPTHFLSGGQKKRVSIADVVVMEPDLILFDEPAASLDPKYIKVVDDIIEMLNGRGVTIIVATHDVDRAFVWADRVAIFQEGRIVACGDTENVFRNQEVLMENHLNKPKVLELFDNLVEKNILDKSLKTPKSINDLEAYIVGKYKV